MRSSSSRRCSRARRRARCGSRRRRSSSSAARCRGIRQLSVGRWSGARRSRSAPRAVKRRRIERCRPAGHPALLADRAAQGHHRARARNRSGARSVSEGCARAGRRRHQARRSRGRFSKSKATRRREYAEGPGRRARNRRRLHADARHSRCGARAHSRDAEPQRSVEARERHRGRVRRHRLRRGCANLVLLPLATKLRGLRAAERVSRELIIEGMVAVQEGLNPRVIEQKLRGFLRRDEQDGAGRRMAPEPCGASRARHSPISRVSRERWLVSYADFITLLFAFFATMYAISSVDAQKLTTVAHALQVAFDDFRADAHWRPATGPLSGNGAAPCISDGAEQLEHRRRSRRSRASSPTNSPSRPARTDRRSPWRHAVDSRGRHLWRSGATSCPTPHKELVGRVATTLGRFANCGPRRRAHRRRADSQRALCVELGSLDRARQPRGRVPDRARPRSRAAVGDRLRASFIRACPTRRPKRAPATVASIS